MVKRDYKSIITDFTKNSESLRNIYKQHLNLTTAFKEKKVDYLVNERNQSNVSKITKEVIKV